MLNIIDINTPASDLKLIQRLKEEFRTLLSPTVNEGSVIMISNFPAVGNMLTKIDLILIVHIPGREGNYFKLKLDQKNKYFHNGVLMLKHVKDDLVLSVDDAAIYSHEGDFDYHELLNQYIYDFRDYCLPNETIWGYGIYQITSEKAAPFYNSRLLANRELTAKYLLWSMMKQAHEKTPAFCVNSFAKESPALYSHDRLIDFCRKLVDKANAGAKYGILTKKKIDELAKPTKVIDDILENIGKSLSIITGKAGTGKTLALTKVLRRYQEERHHVRFLTYNNLLVFDIRQLLRNFPSADTKLSAMSVHSFFYKQSHTLGIPLLLSGERVSELMLICSTRIEKLQPIYDELSGQKQLTVESLLSVAATSGFPKADFEEIGLFARFARGKQWPLFKTVSEEYFTMKRGLLTKSIGSEIFLQDYYKVLELLHMAVTDTEQFYKEQGIKDRYELLATLYDTDNFIESNESERNLIEYKINAQIPIENLIDRVDTVRRQVGWSKLMLVDESQDFHLYEKELLFHLRKPANMVIASGGKEQLIRHSRMLNWTVSFNKKVPHLQFPLRNRSFRQKANIVGFANAFAKRFEIALQLQSVAESTGLGKIIIDLRPKTGFIPQEIVTELRDNGKINGCSNYESLIFLVPSKGYTDKVTSDNFSISDNDVVTTVRQTSARTFKFKKELSEMDLLCWDGVSEHKSALKIPYHTETRIIHYESCRGLEAWSCAMMGMDSYFEHKRKSEEASRHLADELMLSETEREDKYAALWCLMAFTRPMDSLYIQLDNPASRFTNLILEISRDLQGIAILR